MVLEGLHALKHALRFGAELIDARTADVRALADLARDLAPDVADRIVEMARPIDADTFARLGPRPHPTGVIALAHRPEPAVPELLARSGPGQGPVVLLERPTHHGNIGAVVRVAAAAGAAGVLVSGPHDPWHPSAIRGGAGLQFALPVASVGPDAAAPLARTERPLVALDPEGEPLGAPGPSGDDAGPAPGDARPGGAAGSSGAVPPGAILAFGSERSGVSDALLRRADRTVSIPMRPGVSSLNLATAVAVALYLAGGGAPSWT